MKVDFMIVGVQKGGTTALRAMLSGHPEIYFPEKKEIHYFTNNSYFTDGSKPDYSVYHSHFTGRANEKVVGEKTPGYIFFDEVPARLYEYNSKLKLITVLRNPIDRAYSNYQMLRRNKNLSMPFIDRLKIERELDNKSAPRRHTESLIARGFYTEQVRRIRRIFPESQLHFVKQEELKNNRDRVLADVFEFLDVDPFSTVEEQVSEYPPLRDYEPMDDMSRAYLSGIYYYEVKQLERELDWDCSDWLKSMIV